LWHFPHTKHQYLYQQAKKLDGAINGAAMKYLENYLGRRRMAENKSVKVSLK
jgi:hypothetical protein